MATAMYSPPPGIPSSGTHGVRIGRTLKRKLGLSDVQSTTEYHSFQYPWKPNSIDSSKGGNLESIEDNGSGSRLRLEQYTAQNERQVFTGAEKENGTWDCVLVYDEATQTFTLETLTTVINFRHDREATKAAKRRAGEEVSETPSGASSTPLDEPTPLLLPPQADEESPADPSLVTSEEMFPDPLANGLMHDALDEDDLDAEGEEDDLLTAELEAELRAQQNATEEELDALLDAIPDDIRPVREEPQDESEVEEVEPPSKRRRLSNASQHSGRNPHVNGVSGHSRPAPPPRLHLPQRRASLRSAGPVQPESAFDEAPSRVVALPNGHNHYDDEDDDESDSDDDDDDDEDEEDDDEAMEPGSEESAPKAAPVEDEDDEDFDFLADALQGDNEVDGASSEEEDDEHGYDDSPLARQSRTRSTRMMGDDDD